MNEGVFTQKLVKALREHPAIKHNAIVWKHSDRFNRGIPDFSISMRNKTIWFEVKAHDANPTKIQAYYLKLLHDGGSLIRMSPQGTHAWMDDDDFYEFEQLVDKVVSKVLGVQI